jgi:phosphoglycolate phosphatase/pyrophosphatase PpaX
MKPGPPGYRGVVFDMDGTLLDSMPLVVRGLAMAVEPFRPRPDRREIMASLGGPSEACLRRLLGGETHVAAALARHAEFLGRHEGTAQLFPGARKLVEDLHQAGIQLGIWTGRERSMAVARLGALALEHCFSVLVCGDDLASHKPDPEGLLRILAQWRLAPGAALFVGDSDQDLAGARAAGVPMVAIRQDREVAPELLKHPVAVVETPPQAYAWVRAAVLGGK